MADILNETISKNWPLGNLQKINIHEIYTRQRQSLRPWFEFCNTSKFKTPANFGIVTRRLLANVEHFQTNYFVIILVLSIYCVLTTPSLLFVLLIMGVGSYLINIKNRTQPIVIMGRQIPVTQQYIALFALGIPLLVIVGAGSAIFWILGASVFIIVLHAIFHQTPNQDAFGLQMEEV